MEFTIDVEFLARLCVHPFAVDIRFVSEKLGI
jgi:hypothetical protein